MKAKLNKNKFHNDTYVCVNGRSYLIRRDVEVNVPEEILAAIPDEEISKSSDKNIIIKMEDAMTRICPMGSYKKMCELILGLIHGRSYELFTDESELGIQFKIVDLEDESVIDYGYIQDIVRIVSAWIEDIQDELAGEINDDIEYLVKNISLFMFALGVELASESGYLSKVEVDNSILYRGIVLVYGSSKRDRNQHFSTVIQPSLIDDCIDVGIELNMLSPLIGKIIPLQINPKEHYWMALEKVILDGKRFEFYQKTTALWNEWKYLL